MNDSEIIARGERAGMLLLNPAFCDVVDDLSSLYLSQLVAAQPGKRDREARDYAHLMHHSLLELVSQLRLYEAAGSEVAKRLRDEADEI